MFPASVLLNRALGAEERGLLALVLLVPGTIFTIGSCQWDRLLQGVIATGQASSAEVWRRTKRYAGILSLIVVPVSVAASLSYWPLGSEGKIISALYSLTFPVYFLCGCLGALLVSCGSIDGQYAMRLVHQAGYLVLVTAMIATGNVSVAAVVVVYALIHVLNLSVGLIAKKGVISGPAECGPVSGRPLRRALPPYILESVAGRMDLWVMSLLAPLATIGQYSGITALMMPVSLMSNALTSASTARLDWKSAQQVRHYLRKVLVALGLIAFVVVLSSALIGSWLLEFVLGSSFSDGAWMLPWVALLVAAQAASTQFHTAVRLSGREKEYLNIQTGEAFFRCTFVAAGGYLFGVGGIILALIVSAAFKVSLCLRALQSLRGFEAQV